MNEHLSKTELELLKSAEFLWVVLANVSGGDWDKQTDDWKLAAAKARDDFHSVAKSIGAFVS